MGARGRKSADDLLAVEAVVSRPSPPADLSAEAAAVWRNVVNSQPPIWFHVAFSEAHLERYCNAVADAKELDRSIKDIKRANGHGDKKVLLGFMKQRAQTDGIVMRWASRLRLTQSSRRVELLRKNLPTDASPTQTEVTRPRLQRNRKPFVMLPPPWEYGGPLANPTQGDKVIWFIENHCRVPEGDKFVGQPVRLRGWQKNLIRGIYDTTTRRAIISFPRKNGKTALAALFTLAHLVGPCSKINSNLFSDAQSKEQAAVLFGLAAKCVRLSSTLVGYVSVRETIKVLACSKRGTVYRSLSAEVSTSFGLSTPFVVHDELGQVRGPRSPLYEAIETSMGAYENPLSIVISTQAPNHNDLLSILIDDAETGQDPNTKLFMFGAPEDADPFLESTWRAANPAYGDFLNPKEVRDGAEIAQRMPSREAGFRNLNLNQRSEGEALFVSRTVWEENAAEPTPLKGQTVHGGLDLAEVSDLCALEVVTDTGDVHSFFWLPEEGLKEKSREDKVEYDVWAKKGLLLTTPGRCVEYEYIAEFLRGLFDQCMVKAIAFDRYHMKFLVPWLRKANFTEKELERFIPFGQGFVSMSPAIRELESRLLMKKLKHGDHPVLKMCAANTRIMKDPAGNRKFNKAKATGRIDGMVALAMAVGVMPSAAPPKKFTLMFA